MLNQKPAGTSHHNRFIDTRTRSRALAALLFLRGKSRKDQTDAVYSGTQRGRQGALAQDSRGYGLAVRGIPARAYEIYEWLEKS